MLPLRTKNFCDLTGNFVLASLPPENNPGYAPVRHNALKPT